MGKDLSFKFKNAYDVCDEAEVKNIYDYAEGYRDFLNNAKTERDAVKKAIALAEKEGFKEYKLGDKIEKGGKYYCNNRNKSLYVFVIGKEDITNGIRISAAHIDSPRIDLKQNPLYQDGEMAFFKTHYYGGIKKYQWTTIPLAIHGVVVKENGETVDVCIGEDDNDPIFYVTDLLPHLGKDQMSKTMSEGVTGESLNILVGSKPEGDGDDKLRSGVLAILNEKYGITEADFVSSELTCVPAYKVRDVGFDRSLLGGYGHDDKVCSYPALTAIFEASKTQPEHTLMAILADKEEIGSCGNTGMKTAYFVDLIAEIADQLGANERIVRANSKCLSADVNAAYDPNYSEVYEKKNCGYVNKGVVITKFTGARGKSGSSDASAEYLGFIRKILNEAGVVWQHAELGKVDQGGGGTVASYIAEKNIDTIDMGVGVLSMHAPYEVISKADLYMTHKAFAAFNK